MKALPFKHVRYSLFCLLYGLSFSSYAETIHLGFNTWPGYEAVAITDQKGFFKNEGLDVDVHQYRSLEDVKEAFAKKKIDIMFSTTNEVLMLAEKDNHLKTVLVADYSNGTDALVAQKSIQTIADLKGKKVGVEIGTISHFLLLKALKSVNLSEDDVTLVDIKPQDSLAKFKDKSVDAITVWAPYTKSAIKAGGHELFSSSAIPGQIVDVMSMRDEFLEKHPEEAFKIVSAYLKTLDWFEQHKEEGIAIAAKAGLMTTKELSAALEGVKLTGIQDNLVAFGTSRRSPGTLYPATKELMTFLEEEKVLSDSVNTDKLIDPALIWKYAG